MKRKQKRNTIYPPTPRRRRTGGIRNTKGAILILALCLMGLMLSQGLCLGATYYVADANGNDSNPGTNELPWKTISRAQNYKEGYIPLDTEFGYGIGDPISPMVQPGDTVIVRDGNYGTFNENNAENPRAKWYITHRDDWITYRAADGHTPTLTNIAIRNEDYSPDSSDHGDSYLRFEGFRITGAESSNSVLFYFTNYVHIKDCEIRQFEEPYEGEHQPYYWPGLSGVYTRTAAHITVEGCNVHGVFRGINTAFADNNNITIHNNEIHDFAEDGIYNIASYSSITNNYIHHCKPRRTTVHIYGTLSGSFETGDEVTQADTNARGVYCKSTANYHEIWETSETAFATAEDGGGDITGSDGTLSDITYRDPQHNDGIAMHAHTLTNVDIIGNTIHTTTAYAIQGIKLATYSEGSISNITIENNLLYDLGTDDSRSVSIYAAREPVFGEADATYSNIKINNNTFCGKNLNFRNSVLISEFYNNIARYLVVEESKGIVSHGNNIFGNNPDGQGGPSYPFTVDTSSELVNYDIDSLFVDATGGDFRLAETSVAIDFGDPAYAPGIDADHPYGVDITGQDRNEIPDAGCYEYVALTFLYGDVSGDNTISAYDAALVAMHAVGLITLTDEQARAADVTDNGSVSATDAAWIARRAVDSGIVFPVEE